MIQKIETIIGGVGLTIRREVEVLVLPTMEQVYLMANPIQSQLDLVTRQLDQQTL